MLSSCSIQPKPEASATEANIKSKILGTWHVYESHSFGGADFQKTFYADGTAKGFIRPNLRSGKDALYLPWIHFTSRWKVEGSSIFIYDMKSPIAEIFEEGEVHHDAIISISSEKIKYWDGPTRNITTYIKGPLKTD